MCSALAERPGLADPKALVDRFGRSALRGRRDRAGRVDSIRSRDACRRGRLVHPVVQGRRPRRRHRRARAPGVGPASRRHRGRSRELVGSGAGRHCGGRRPGGCGSRLGGRATARHGLPRRGRKGREACAPVERHEIGSGGCGPRRRARRREVGERGGLCPRRLLHRHQAPLARRARTGQRPAHRGGLPATRLAHLEAARIRAPARRDDRVAHHGSQRRQRHRLLVVGDGRVPN